MIVSCVPTMQKNKNKKKKNNTNNKKQDNTKIMSCMWSQQSGWADIWSG